MLTTLAKMVGPPVYDWCAPSGASMGFGNGDYLTPIIRVQEADKKPCYFSVMPYGFMDGGGIGCPPEQYYLRVWFDTMYDWIKV